MYSNTKLDVSSFNTNLFLGFRYFSSLKRISTLSGIAKRKGEGGIERGRRERESGAFHIIYMLYQEKKKRKKMKKNKEQNFQIVL